ncbi:MAG: pyridoxamine 5'-phosphate oxidase family protein [Bryobacteraceae bacterium]|nr:pyridoxamine 5'-phosphate oxidase family protein [Bryobacteraceae bacterium]
MTTSENGNTSREQGLQMLQDLLRGLKFGMLTAMRAGALRARPMTLLQCSDNGDLWFLTSKLTSLVPDVEQDDRVNVSFSSGEDLAFISVSGRAQVVIDRAKLAELWQPSFVKWFPLGPDDPNVSLLRVHAESAESWNSIHRAFTFLFGVIRAITTGEPARPTSDHMKLELQ